MAFENVTIQVTKGSSAALPMWRQDCAAGSVMSFALSDTTGVNTFAWRLVGRPEGSGAGGGGPESLSLGTAQTANITIDLRGTYVVECLVNAGAPNAETLRAGCAYLETITSPDGLPLRLLGPGESDEDNSDPLVRQGWIKMLNRWLKTISGGGAVPTPFFHVRKVQSDYDPTGITTSGANTWFSRADVTGFVTGANSILLLQAVVSGTVAAKDVKVFARITMDGNPLPTSVDASAAAYDGGPVNLSILCYEPLNDPGPHDFHLEISSSTTDGFSEAYASDHTQGARLVVTELGFDTIPTGLKGDKGDKGDTGPAGTGGDDIASWDPTLVRYIFLDGDAGNDANVGYIDAAPGHDFTGTDLSTISVKTTHRINQIRKLVGAGRMCVVLIKPRASSATYDHATTSDGLGTDDRSLLFGYSLLHTRGSDLTNSLTDRKQLGYVVTSEVHGPGSTGEWTVSAVLNTSAGTLITLTGATLPASRLLSKYRIRALLRGTTTVYGAIKWGAVMASESLCAWSGPIAGIHIGDKVWLEQPGAVLRTFSEAASGLKGFSGLSAAGLGLVSGGLIGCSDDQTVAHYSHIVVKTGGSVVSSNSLVSSASILGVYTDEANVTGMTTGPGLFSPVLNFSGYYFRMQYSSMSESDTGAASDETYVTATSGLEIDFSILQSAILTTRTAGAMILNGLVYGQLVVAPSGHATVGAMRGFNGWNSLLKVQPSGGGVYSSGVSLDFSDMHNVQSGEWEGGVAEPSSPGIELCPGIYTVTLDLGDGPAYGIFAGNGVQLDVDTAGIITPIISYLSLATTGFELIEGQKVLVKFGGKGFPGDMLLCPRGRAVLCSGEPGDAGQILGPRINDATDNVVFSVQALSNSVVEGVALTNFVPPEAGTAYGVMGTERGALMMVNRDSTVSTVPAAGTDVYLSITNQGTFALTRPLIPDGSSSYDNEFLLGAISPMGTRSTTGPCAVQWLGDKSRTLTIQATEDANSTNNTTRINIGSLMTLTPGRWSIEAQLKFSASATGGISVSLNPGSGFAEDGTKRSLSGAVEQYTPSVALAALTDMDFGSGSSVGAIGPTNGYIRIRGIIWVTAVATLGLSFSKAAALGTDAIIRQGSYFRATPT